MAEAAQLAAQPIDKLTGELHELAEAETRQTRESIEHETRATGASMGFQESDPDELIAAIGERVNELRAALEEGDTSAARELAALDESGIVRQAAELSRAKKQAREDERAEAREQMEYETALLDAELKTEQVKQEEYAAKRLALLDKIHAAEAAADTPQNAGANERRRNLERLKLVEQLDALDKKEPKSLGGDGARLTDSITRMGGSSGANYAALNAGNWQATLTDNSAKQVRLLEQTNKLLEKLNSPAKATAVLG
jgi:hypothetical protein